VQFQPHRLLGEFLRLETAPELLETLALRVAADINHVVPGHAPLAVVLVDSSLHGE
jgi:hypothetical protein